MPTRTISRTVTNAVPAWRAAMTTTDRLYYVTAQPPGQAPAFSNFPTRFGRNGVGIFGAAWDVLSGFSSGELLEDIGGPFGTMAYGTGGHLIIANQLLGLGLSPDAPTWDWFQLPTFKTSDTGGANMYYAPAEEAALVAGPRGTAARIVSNQTGGSGAEGATAAAWDRQFPVAFEGWIFPRKLTTGQMGDGVAHGMRYNSIAYIPASVTGSDPVLFAGLGPQGPFEGNIFPTGVTLGDWFDASALASASLRRFPYYFMNCRTKAWTVHEWQPVGTSLGGFSSPRVGTFRDLKRIYVVGSSSLGNGYYYIDMANGIAGHTLSAHIPASFGVHRYGSCAFSEGDPRGRHFMVAVAQGDPTTTLLTVYNFDAGTAFQIDLAAAGFTVGGEDERVGLSYDPANQRVLVVMAQPPNENQPFYWSISVPEVLTNAAGWVASKRFLTFDDTAMATSIFSPGQSSQNRLAGFYGKTRLHSMLGTVLMPSADFRNVAFVPSA